VSAWEHLLASYWQPGVQLQESTGTTTVQALVTAEGGSVGEAKSGSAFDFVFHVTRAVLGTGCAAQANKQLNRRGVIKQFKCCGVLGNPGHAW
jgi:hypothetical protein